MYVTLVESIYMFNKQKINLVSQVLHGEKDIPSNIWERAGAGD